MTLDKLIIELILQDLQNNQLVYGLDRLNLYAGYCHFLGILDWIQRLMEVPAELGDAFCTVYLGFMQRCLEFPISRSCKELRPLASKCFDNLRAMKVE